MKFAEQQFTEAVELIQALDPNKKRRDKRRAPRTHIRLTIDIKISVAADCAWIKAQLQDISPRGLRLDCEQAIPLGDSFLVRLPNKNEQGPQAPLVCRVVFCAPKKKLFTIGAEFIGRQAPQGPSASEEQLERIRRSILD